jgi:phosphomannomutase
VTPTTTRWCANVRRTPRRSYGIEIDDVRLLIRPSGTEPVVRVMIEALDGSFVDEFSHAPSKLFVS